MGAVIVKLGGSVISNKNEPFSFNGDAVRNIAQEIKKFYTEKNFIIVHGGGSFGHPLAKKYGIRNGVDGGAKKLLGFSHTHAAMIELNERIIKIFINEGLPAFSISSSSIFILENGKIRHAFVDGVKKAMDMNLIPVLFGDVAIDLGRGMDILSGDQIVSFLAQKFEAEKAIFLMDVDGVYDRNPSSSDAKLIEEIGEEMEVLAINSRFDVTGGIKYKIEEAMKIDCTVYFINGLKKGNLTKAIKGEKIGTIKKIEK